MSSITAQPGGRHTIQFIGSDGKRRSIRLGVGTRKQAEAVQCKVDDLVSASILSGTPRDETARWLASVDDVMNDKLAAVGLIPRRRVTTLAAFVDDYIAGRIDVKPGTLTVYGHTRRCLVDHLGASRPLRTITPGDADAFRLFLIAAGLRENTTRRRCGIARQFFNAAIRKRLIDSNPFAGLPSQVRGNSQRSYMVTLDEAEKVLAACPDAEWRLIFALARFAGLRCPSEILGLRWCDVDWDRQRFLVHSPKTEHHEGKAERWVPIFSRLLPYMREAFEQAEPGAVHAVTRYRHNNNLRTQLQRIIRRAGLTPWPKLFQNLRSTCQTELEDYLPFKAVCEWLGNSERVAQEHYLQVTDDHWLRAVEPLPKAVQNPVQQGAADECNATQGVWDDIAETPENKAFRDRVLEAAYACNGLQTKGMGPGGFEPPTSPLSAVRSDQLSYEP